MKGIATSIVVALLSCSSALAATIDIHWNSPVFNPGGGSVGTINYPVGQSVTAAAGRYSGVVASTVGIDAATLIASGSEFYAYCFDLAQYLGNDTYTVVPGAPSAALDFLGAANAYFGGGPFRWLLPMTSDQATAIQVGIWEALFNDDFALTTGGVTFSAVPSSVATIFNDINALRPTSADLGAQYVIRLTSASTQDLITGVRPVSRVPEPHSVALLGLAAMIAGLHRRRAL
ncbi:MAG TPA: PEP-CTERM sorting domain-containing protein [Casimicrobiaceae bacterium]|nr:PEP-CTERM sorting domain-containing protein [Casimicrobiaceae bacterium]